MKGLAKAKIDYKALGRKTEILNDSQSAKPTLENGPAIQSSKKLRSDLEVARLNPTREPVATLFLRHLFYGAIELNGWNEPTGRDSTSASPLSDTQPAVG